MRACNLQRPAVLSNPEQTEDQTGMLHRKAIVLHNTLCSVCAQLAPQFVKSPRLHVAGLIEKNCNIVAY